MRHLFLLLFVGISFFAITQTSSTDDIENPRMANDSWVANPDYVINNSEVQELNTRLQEIESETNYEIAIVLVNSINGNVAYDFGLDLFNKWGICKKESDN